MAQYASLYAYKECFVTLKDIKQKPRITTCYSGLLFFRYNYDSKLIILQLFFQQIPGYQNLSGQYTGRLPSLG